MTMTTLRWRWALLVLALLLTLANVLYNRYVPIRGDGHEYTLMTQSLLAHGTPDLRLGDIKAVDRAFRERGGVHTLPHADLLAKAMQDKPATIAGFFLARDDRYYSYHFWLYPLINAPAMAFVNAVEASPTWSFVLTNSILALITTTTVLFAGTLPMVARVTLLALYLFGGLTYYVNWTHPEVMTASCMVLAFMLVGYGRYWRAAFLLAAAAQQNPPVGFLAALTLLYGASIEWQAWRSGQHRLVTALVRLALPSLLLVASPVFYYVLFGTPNLIAAHGMAVASLASWERLWSLYFDLDQGMIRAIPWAMLTLATVICATLTRRNLVTFPTIAVSAALVACSMMLAAPSLSTTNWNSGALVVMRYAYWAAIPIVLAVVVIIASMPVRAAAMVAGFMIVAQAWLVVDRRVYGIEDHNLRHTRAAKLAARFAPDLYNPIPEIFVERTRSAEEAPRDHAYLFVWNGVLTKVLTSNDNNTVYLPGCNLTVYVGDADVSVVPAELGWRYLNVHKRCELSNGFHVSNPHFPKLSEGLIDFSAKGNSQPFKSGGWSVPEDWGAWTDGSSAWLQIALDAAQVSQALELVVHAHGFVPQGTAPQRAQVTVNGYPVGQMTFPGFDPVEQVLALPPDVLASSRGHLMIRFIIEQPLSPVDLGYKGDARRLGIGFHSIQIRSTVD